MFLVSTQNLLLVFIALELLSLSLYILTAFNKRSRQSAEAALKYFLFGGMSAAFLLFGISLLYGLSGSINLVEIDRGPSRAAAHSAAGRGDGDDGDRLRIQGGRGSFSPVGARCVPGCAYAQWSVHRLELQSGQLLHLRASDAAGLGGRGGKRRMARLCDRLGSVAWLGCGPLDDSGQSGGARADAVSAASSPTRRSAMPATCCWASSRTLSSACARFSTT